MPPRTRDYLIRLPKDTWVKAACEDVNCELWRDGWETVCDLDDPAGRLVAEMIRSGKSARTYREMTPAGARVAVFRFERGQRCFAEHRTRPAVFAVRQGRQVTGLPRLAEWGNDLAEHWDRVQTLEEKG